MAEPGGDAFVARVAAVVEFGGFGAVSVAKGGGAFFPGGGVEVGELPADGRSLAIVVVVPDGAGGKERRVLAEGQDGFAFGEVAEAFEAGGVGLDEVGQNEVGEGEDGGGVGSGGGLGEVEVALDEEGEFFFVGRVGFNFGDEGLGGEDEGFDGALPLLFFDLADLPVEVGEGFGHGEVLEVSAFEVFDEGGGFVTERERGVGGFELEEAVSLDLEDFHHFIEPGGVTGLEGEEALEDGEGLLSGRQSAGSLFAVVVDGGVVVPGVGEIEEPAGVVGVPVDEALAEGEGFVEKIGGFVDAILFFECDAEVIEEGGEFLVPVSVVGIEGYEFAGAGEGIAVRGFCELLVAHVAGEHAGVAMG